MSDAVFSFSNVNTFVVFLFLNSIKRDHFCFVFGSVPKYMTGTNQPHTLWNRIGRQRILKKIKSNLPVWCCMLTIWYLFHCRRRHITQQYKWHQWNELSLSLYLHILFFIILKIQKKIRKKKTEEILCYCAFNLIWFYGVQATKYLWFSSKQFTCNIQSSDWDFSCGGHKATVYSCNQFTEWTDWVRKFGRDNANHLCARCDLCESIFS